MLRQGEPQQRPAAGRDPGSVVAHGELAVAQDHLDRAARRAELGPVARTTARSVERSF
ncbi:MAG TPA: hypothetical protein VKU77_01370 [Streptosporangiaceae bacterium]|nr:hypothetical protein [Streptosporangiaceae bacterium]